MGFEIRLPAVQHKASDIFLTRMAVIRFSLHREQAVHNNSLPGGFKGSKTTKLRDHSHYQILYFCC